MFDLDSPIACVSCGKPTEWPVVRCTACLDQPRTVLRAFASHDLSWFYNQACWARMHAGLESFVMTWEKRAPLIENPVVPTEAIQLMIEEVI